MDWSFRNSGFQPSVLPSDGVIGDVESRDAAFLQVGAVGARNAHHIAAEVRAQVGRLHVLTEPGPAEGSVNQKGRR